MKIGYARVSTSRQSESLATQREALLQTGCDPEKFFSDVISGANWSRPGLDAALEFMRGEDTLVVTRLDRLGRNLYETVATIADLGARDINVQILEPALDTSRPSDKVVINVMASLAEWERELLIERTKEGVAYARSQGRVPGPKPKLTDEQARLVKLAVDSGESVAAVARTFQVSRATVYRALDRMIDTVTP